MSKQYYKLLIILFINAFLFASAPKFSAQKEFNLKKDEWDYFYINIRGKEKFIPYYFSWTLYDNNNLILFTKFNGYTKQYVISLRRRLDYIKDEITKSYNNYNLNKAEVFLQFADFKDNKAKIIARIYDENSLLEVDFNKKGK